MFFRPLFFSLPISDPHCLRNAFSLCTFLLSKPRLGFTTTSRRPTHACTKACHLPCLPTSHLPSQPPTSPPPPEPQHQLKLAVFRPVTQLVCFCFCFCFCFCLCFYICVRSLFHPSSSSPVEKAATATPPSSPASPVLTSSTPLASR